MNKADAKSFVYDLTIKSLRKMAGRITSGDISMKASQKDVTKVKGEFETLAKKLEGKPGRIIDANDEAVGGPRPEGKPATEAQGPAPESCASGT